MRIQFTFRNLDSSDALKQHATDKLTKLQKYLRAPLDVEVTLSVERHLHCADVHLSTHSGETLQGRDESDDMYASIDLVVDKIRKQLVRTSGRRASRIHSA